MQKLLVILPVILLSACANEKGPKPVAALYGASTDRQVLSSGPVAGDDVAMKQKPGTLTAKQTAKGSSKTTNRETTTESTETTTVLGSSTVAAPDNEVKTNQ